MLCFGTILRSTFNFREWFSKYINWCSFFFVLFCFSFIFVSWRLITLQYCSGFCHTLTWISHGFTCVPHPDPPSHLPVYPIPLGLPSAPGPSTCLMLMQFLEQAYYWQQNCWLAVSYTGRPSFLFFSSQKETKWKPASIIIFACRQGNYDTFIVDYCMGYSCEMSYNLLLKVKELV